MKKKELWVALGALSIVANTDVVIPGNIASASERAGVASKVNPAVKHMTAKGSRVLFVGSDIFRNETIRTDTSGRAHLMFLDKSSLTVGPNSEMTIDHFVYDPETNSGDLSMSAAKGLLHFVGGSLSKSKKGVELKTTVGNLGIRGAVALIDVLDHRHGTTAYLLYGNEISATIPGSGLSKSIKAHEHYLSITPDGRIETGPIPPGKLNDLLYVFHGAERQFQHITLHDDYPGYKSQGTGSEPQDTDGKLKDTDDKPKDTDDKPKDTDDKAQDTDDKPQDTDRITQGPDSNSPNVTLPDNYHHWMRELTTSDRARYFNKTEQSSISLMNRDIDSLAS